MPTALIAEDEPMLRAQLRARLADAWPELTIVAEAENGQQALALIEQTAPDGKKNKGRFTFFNQGPDQVRQLNEISADEGKTWQTVYDFTYIRKK